MVQRLYSFVLGLGEDKTMWFPEKDGYFSTKSTFMKLIETSPKLQTPLIYFIWKDFIPKKVKVCLWTLAH